MIRIKTKYLYCLLAPSGSGKDVVSNELHKRYGLTKIPSYTTRPRRINDPNDINSHIFANQAGFDLIKNDLFCYDHYSGFDYGATEEQAKEYNLYIVNASGVRWGNKNYCGNVKLKVIYLDVPEDVRKNRMMLRGDSWKQINQRLLDDSIEFKNAKELADLIVENDDLNKCVNQIWNYIQKCEGDENT